MSLTNCRLLVLVIMAMLTCYGRALHLETSPATFNSLIHSELNITCISDGPAFWAKSVVTLEIAKAGSKPIAVVHGEKVQLGTGSSGNMAAFGHIEDDASHSYIKVMIQNPGLSDAGTYSCEMFYLNEEIQMHVEKTYINITVDNPNLGEVVYRLLDRVVDLENTTKKQEKILTEQSDAISRYEKILKNQSDTTSSVDKQPTRQDVDSFRKTIGVLNETITKQEQLTVDQGNQLANQEKTIKALKSSMLKCTSDIGNQETRLDNYIKQRYENDSYVNAFSFGFDSKDSFVGAGSTLIFSQKILQIGEGYDPNTGTFTCHREGIYVFHLFLLTNADDADIRIDLAVNGATKATLQAHDKELFDQSAISTVVHLQAGDNVKPVVNAYGGQKTIYPDDHWSVFSGYLLKLT